MVNTVVITRAAQKDLRRVSAQIRASFARWVALVETSGIMAARAIPGYNDEALEGKRKHQRSVRLSQGYRAIYVTKKDGAITFISVEEITNHEY
jgi:mRNA-degrading endonuclease RelE of RelBE toxin-antitoxin system